MKLLKRSETANFIKDELNRYFKEPTEYEKRRILMKMETKEIQKKALDAKESVRLADNKVSKQLNVGELGGIEEEMTSSFASDS